MQQLRAASLTKYLVELYLHNKHKERGKPNWRSGNGGESKRYNRYYSNSEWKSCELWLSEMWDEREPRLF